MVAKGAYEIVLPARLELLVRLVPESCVVADVGTGDALVPVVLIRTGKARKVIACDRSARALEMCRRTFDRYGLSPAERDCIELREGDGLRPLKRGEARVAVVAGMGGLTIEKILSRGPVDVAGVYVLGPMSHAKDLRIFLHTAGFTLVEEAMVCQAGKFYEFEVATPPGSSACAAEAGSSPSQDRFPLVLSGEIGALLWRRRDPVLKSFLVCREAKLGLLEQRVQGTQRAREISRLRRQMCELISLWDSCGKFPDETGRCQL